MADGSRKTICRQCHKAKKHAAHGMCRLCYNHWFYKTYKHNCLKTAERLKLLKRYGLTEVQYQELLSKQYGVCAICGETCSKYNRLSVDHDHNTGKVRGLLCNSCNVGLANFKDDPQVLKKAASYLET